MGRRLGARVLLGIPTLSTARRSTTWIDALGNLQMPLGSSLGRVWIEDRPIAEARNALCERALAEGVDYLVMIGDDVLAPPNLLLAMLDKIDRWQHVGDGVEHRAKLITGVYWTKTHPTEPYLWNGLLEGSYRDWRVGEFFPVDLAGCDALMIAREVLEQVPRPWFSTDWTWSPGEKPSSIATEDFYFFTKARRAGFRLFADTGIQCLHEDRATGQLFGLSSDMPQAGGVPECGEDTLLVADLGSGTDTPYFGPNARVVRFDGRPDVRPDVRCDLLAIPEAHRGQYDLVHARHVLEHFDRAEAPAALAHWAGLLKPGGTLKIRVPNLGWALRQLLDEQAGPEARTYAKAQLYGGQAYQADYHRNGFDARSLRALLATTPGLEEGEVAEEDDGQNLCGTARLPAAVTPPAIDEWWDEIKRREAPIPPPVREEAAVG